MPGVTRKAPGCSSSRSIAASLADATTPSAPAAIAVWALVKPRVFAAYLGIAMAGSLIAGLIWGIVAV